MFDRFYYEVYIYNNIPFQKIICWLQTIPGLTSQRNLVRKIISIVVMMVTNSRMVGMIRGNNKN